LSWWKGNYRQSHADVRGEAIMLRKTVGTVGTLAQEAVSTAVSVARHPIGSASLAVGFAKGIAGTGLDLVRGATSHGPSAREHTETSSDTDTLTAVPEQSSPAETQADTPAETPEVAEDPRDQLPGPDLAAFEPPRPEDLPEPIVIEAVDEPGESFHTEPKAANRDSARGGTPGDHEEIEGYVEEIPTDDIDIETPVGTTGADVGFNPDTAEADLQQPGTPPILDPAVVSEVLSESEILRKAADPRPE
jgi:hypothetical protein